MIGEDYFDLRSRLGADLYALSGIVQDLGGNVEDQEIIENLIASLNDPFVFVVAGEVNVGKSTFLNALFGADFSRTGVMPTTDKIYFFKHGPTVQTTSISPTLDEVRVPCDFLKDFHIVDTPGTNSIEGEHQQITERFVPMADLVVFVFSAMNPWGASAWQFLEKVHRHWMRHVIFVLQQCDLRTPEEIQVITDYMGQLARQRFGRDFPLFPISAKKAYLARSSGIDREKLMAQSGFEPLEKHISSTVTQSPTRLSKMSSAMRLAMQILDHLIEVTDSGIAEQHRTRGLIDDIQAEREVQVQRTLSKYGPALEASDRDYREAAVRVVSLADHNFSIRAAFAAVREDSRMPKNLDHKLYQDLLANAGERWQQVASILEDDFTRFENYMSHHWRGELYLHELRVNEDGIHASAEARKRFTSKVESGLRRFVQGLKIDETLEPGLVRSRDRARRFPWLVMPLVAATAAAFYFMGWQIGLGCLGATLAITLLLLLAIRVGLRGSLRRLAGQFDDARDSLRQTLDEQTHEETENAFGIFTRILQPARMNIETSVALKQKQAEHLYALRLSFQQISDQLKALGVGS